MTHFVSNLDKDTAKLVVPRYFPGTMYGNGYKRMKGVAKGEDFVSYKEKHHEAVLVLHPFFGRLQCDFTRAERGSPRSKFFV